MPCLVHACSTGSSTNLFLCMCVCVFACASCFLKLCTKVKKELFKAVYQGKKELVAVHVHACVHVQVCSSIECMCVLVCMCAQV